MADSRAAWSGRRRRRRPAAQAQGRGCARREEARPPRQKGRCAQGAANLKAGSYSFISGFQNASTVEMQLDYDAERFSFAVVEENFLSYSSNSHVAILEGEDFSLQIEYASYRSGEEADGNWAFLRENHPELQTVRFGGVEGAQYLEGDNVRFCFAIPEDGHSYVEVILFKAKGNDTPLADMPQDPDVNAILSSIRFQKA